MHLELELKRTEKQLQNHNYSNWFNWLVGKIIIMLNYGLKINWLEKSEIDVNLFSFN